MPATAAQFRLSRKISADPLFTPAEKRRFHPSKLPALRAEAVSLAQKSARVFSCLAAAASKVARRRSFSVLGVPATLPHVGATCGFEASGGYALGCVAKAAQTADTGATAWNALPVTAASPASAPIPTFSAADLW